jgi:putative flippase GtrA
MVWHAGVSKQLAQILILFVTIPVNFFLNKLWAFKEKI